MNILMQAVVTKEIPGIPSTDVAGAAYEKCLNKISRVAHKDTKITISYPERSSYLLHSSYGEFLNNSGVIEGAIRGEKEGYDAVIICCYTDCGLQPLREVLEIPVVGLAESSMAIACMLGRKFAIIAPVKEYIPVYEQNLRIYGFESRAIRQKPVRPLSLPSTANRFEQYLRYFEDPHSELIPHFESVAKSCVDDGAEVAEPESLFHRLAGKPEPDDVALPDVHDALGIVDQVVDLSLEDRLEVLLHLPSRHLHHERDGQRRRLRT
jgi:allantoin racemase